MPYHDFEFVGVVVKSEHKQTSLIILIDGKRVFTCEVTAASPTKARITRGDATAKFSFKIRRAIRAWLKHQGYKTCVFERDEENQKEVNV